MLLKNPLKTFGISAELVTRNARPGKCLLTLSSHSHVTSKVRKTSHIEYRKGGSIPCCFRGLGYTDQRRLHFRVPVHRATEVRLSDAVLSEIRVCERDDEVVVCAPSA